MDATSVKITTSILSMVATFAVGGRFWARKIKKQHYGLDDWTVLASLVVMWALAAVILAGAMIGLYDSHALRQAINSRRQVECSRSRRSIGWSISASFSSTVAFLTSSGLSRSTPSALSSY
ncbi:hypothetical protein PMIN06_009073 [Paraphaeosphaeria minitans]